MTQKYESIFSLLEKTTALNQKKVALGMKTLWGWNEFTYKGLSLLAERLGAYLINDLQIPYFCNVKSILIQPCFYFCRSSCNPIVVRKKPLRLILNCVAYALVHATGHVKERPHIGLKKLAAILFVDCGEEASWNDGEISFIRIRRNIGFHTRYWRVSKGICIYCKLLRAFEIVVNALYVNDLKLYLQVIALDGYRRQIDLLDAVTQFVRGQDKKT